MAAGGRGRPLDAWLGEHAALCSIEVPCAGSIAVTLDGAGGLSVAPARYAWHDAFVDTLDTPMCQ